MFVKQLSSSQLTQRCTFDGSTESLMHNRSTCHTGCKQTAKSEMIASTIHRHGMKKHPKNKMKLKNINMENNYTSGNEDNNKNNYTNHNNNKNNNYTNDDDNNNNIQNKEKIYTK